MVSKKGLTQCGRCVCGHRVRWVDMDGRGCGVVIVGVVTSLISDI